MPNYSNFAMSIGAHVMADGCVSLYIEPHGRNQSINFL